MKNELDKTEEREVKNGSYIQSGNFDPRKKRNSAGKTEAKENEPISDQDENPSRIKPFINMYDPFG